MTYWIDIACIVFVSVTMNHLGLVKAAEEVAGRELPVINCCKCASFWLSLIYSSFVTRELITSLAISFLASYIALWLELLEGFIDTLYNKVYEKIYATGSDLADPAGTSEGNPAGSLPEL